MKKKFVSFGVLIALIIACVVLIATLFVLSSVPAVSNTPGLGNANGSTAPGEGDENQPTPAVFEWELPIVVSVTGMDSDTGLTAAWGFDYGIKAVNEAGGIRGLPVRITLRDAGSSNTEIISEIETLAANSLVIMGPPTEAAYKTGGQAFFNAGMPAIGAATDISSRSTFQPFAISCISDPLNTADSVAATWVRLEQFTTACIIYSPTYSERIDNIEDALIFVGKEIVEKIEIGNDIFDAASIAERAFDSEADVFYIDINGEDTLRIITQLRHIAGENADKLRILCGPSAADKELIESAKEGDMYGVRVWTTIDPLKDVEKRKAFDEAFDKSIGEPAYRSLAVDYYQSAIMIKQAIETLGIASEPGALYEERAILAHWLYDSELIHTDHGDFINLDGGKNIEAKFFRITEKGLQ